MVKYEVTVNRNVCLATMACYSTDALHYKSDENHKSLVVGGTTDQSKSTRIFDDDGLDDAQRGAKACPVGAITVKQL
ncbi:MAG: Ferredoxin [Thermoproteota archaeon]|nr:Ferredoxin [Thermoproteota archaeon]